MKIAELFHIEKPIIGMLHLHPLPGAPAFSGSFQSVLDAALKDATVLMTGGVDGFIVENFGDVPFYPDQVPAHTTAYIARVVNEVKRKFDLPLGINVLRNDALAAIAIASATGADFIRVNIHTGCMVTGQGLIQGKAHETTRLRTQLRSNVKIFADVLVKHAQPLRNQSPSQAAKDTYYRGKADALIVSGSATGIAPTSERVQQLKNAVPGIPVLVGSGVTISNIENFLDHADGFIIGTWFKKDDITTNPVDLKKVRLLVDKMKTFR